MGSQARAGLAGAVQAFAGLAADLAVQEHAARVQQKRDEYLAGVQSSQIEQQQGFERDMASDRQAFEAEQQRGLIEEQRSEGRLDREARLEQTRMQMEAAQQTAPRGSSADIEQMVNYLVEIGEVDTPKEGYRVLRQDDQLRSILMYVDDAMRAQAESLMTPDDPEYRSRSQMFQDAMEATGLARQTREERYTSEQAVLEDFKRGVLKRPEAEAYLRMLRGGAQPE